MRFIRVLNYGNSTLASPDANDSQCAWSAGQPALLPGPEGELARALPARVADHDARRAALAGGAAGAGHDRVPRRAHRPARRLRHRRRRVRRLATNPYHNQEI